jgi:hypothetical protein
VTSFFTSVVVKGKPSRKKFHAGQDSGASCEVLA